MKIYNSKDWYHALFVITKSDTLLKLWPTLLIVGLYSLGIAYWEINYLQLHLTENSWVKNIPIMHSLLGFAISMLLVFRTNTAYDRWWEARKQWGTLVNTSRNLAIKLDSILTDENKKSRSFFKKSIPLYAKVLKLHLKAESTRLMLDAEYKTQVDNNQIDIKKHVPNQVALVMMKHITHLRQQDIITTDDWKMIHKDLSTLTDVCGACERIKNTPIPFSYSSFIKKFILIYVITLPFGYVFNLGYWVALMVVIVMYVLASLELIAEEIEDPFGEDENDLPLDTIASNIKRQVEEIL